MKTHSSLQYTVFAPVRLSRNWLEQRPSNQGDLDSSVMMEVWRVLQEMDLI